MAPAILTRELRQLAQEEPRTDIIFGADLKGRFVQILLDHLVRILPVGKIDDAVSDAQQAVTGVALLVDLQGEQIICQPPRRFQEESAFTLAPAVSATKRWVG